MKGGHLVILGILALFPGCTDTGTEIPMLLDSSIDGRNFLSPVNRTIPLELDLNADAGYQWYCTISDTSVVRLDSTRYRPKQSNPIVDGGLTVVTFYFRTRRSGTTTIQLMESRRWLPDVEPIHTVQFSVSVYQ